MEGIVFCYYTYKYSQFQDKTRRFIGGKTAAPLQCLTLYLWITAKTGRALSIASVVNETALEGVKLRENTQAQSTLFPSRPAEVLGVCPRQRTPQLTRAPVTTTERKENTLRPPPPPTRDLKGSYLTFTPLLGRSRRLSTAVSASLVTSHHI